MTWAAVLHFPPDPALPDELRGQSYTVVWGVHIGSEDEGSRLMAPIRELGPLMDTFAMVPPAELGDLAMDPRAPLPFRSSHDLLDGVTPEGIDALVDVIQDAGPNLTLVQIRHLGGALGRKTETAGARATLPGDICLFSLGVAMDERGEREVHKSLAAIQLATKRFKTGYYPNFVEEPADASAFYEPATWQRLREIKSLYDPSDLFKANHPIPPAA
jgi:berberine-like enzyme